MAKRIDPYPSGEDAFWKALREAFRKEARARGFKFRSDTVWRVEDGFIVRASTVPMTLGGMGGRSKMSAKPLEADDLLWEVLGIEGDHDLPMSNRAAGAFIMSGIALGGDSIGIKSFSIADESEVGTLAAAVIDDLEESSGVFLDSIDYDARRYFELLAEMNNVPHNRSLGAYIQGLNRCIALIYLGDLKGALELAKRQIATGDDIFRFGVGSKGDATLIKEYCERKLAEKGE